MINTSPGRWDLDKRLRPSRGPAQKAPRPLSDVTYAGPDDLEPLLTFLREVRDEIDGGRVEEDLLRDLAEQLTHRVKGVALVVRGPYGIEASMGLRAEQPLFSRVHYLRAVWNVVAPEARGTGHAKSLLIKGREFADGLGRPLWAEEYGIDLASGKMALIGRHMRQAGAIFRYAPEVA